VLAGVWYVTTHLLYLVHVTLVLRGITRRRPVEDLAAREDEWRRFRRRVSLMMDNDAMAFVTLGLLTRATLGIEGPAWPALVLGGVLIAAGLGTKAWATASLPAGAYYWRNFFFPDERCRISRTGPYRWLSDPMYSVGYAHLYGVALCLSSLPGLVAAAGAHLLVLLLAVLVERRAFVPPPSRPRGRT
jgi:phosphatidylethanolamine N-methyltransferase